MALDVRGRVGFERVPWKLNLDGWADDAVEQFDCWKGGLAQYIEAASEQADIYRIHQCLSCSQRLPTRLAQAPKA